MARAMVRRAVEEKVPFAWVTADAGHGYSKSRRTELERADVVHVMSTTRHDPSGWSKDMLTIGAHVIAPLSAYGLGGGPPTNRLQAGQRPVTPAAA